MNFKRGHPRTGMSFNDGSAPRRQRRDKRAWKVRNNRKERHEATVLCRQLLEEASA